MMTMMLMIKLEYLLTITLARGRGIFMESSSGDFFFSLSEYNDDDQGGLLTVLLTKQKRPI